VKVIPLISLIVVHYAIVSTCGVTADPTGDVKAQTKKVLETIDRLLEKAGTHKSKLLTAHVWLADGLTDKTFPCGQTYWLKSW